MWLCMYEWVNGMLLKLIKPAQSRRDHLQGFMSQDFRGGGGGGTCLIPSLLQSIPYMKPKTHKQTACCIRLVTNSSIRLHVHSIKIFFNHSTKKVSHLLVSWTVY
jgi:hypothetical protein